MNFEIVGEITVFETIAAGIGIRDIKRLRKNYVKGRWRKCKGVARVRLDNRRIRRAEPNWYEANPSTVLLRLSSLPRCPPVLVSGRLARRWCLLKTPQVAGSLCMHSPLPRHPSIAANRTIERDARNSGVRPQL